MNSPTHFLEDIIRQRTEMPRTIDQLCGPGQKPLEQAASLIRGARDVFITGIGASWNAAQCAGALFCQDVRPVFTQEAGDLLHLATIPRSSVIVAISRTGRSIEIVQLLAKADASGATVVGIEAHGVRLLANGRTNFVRLR